MNDLFELNETPYNFRDPFKLKQPEFSNKTFGFRSFSYYGSKLWNSLPVEIKSSKTLPIFKTRITKWCHSASIDQLIIQ